MSSALRFAEAYAKHMDGWRAEGVYDTANLDGAPYDHIAYLVGPDDVQLNVRAGQYDIRGRVKLSVRYNLPPGAWLDVERRSITISETRNPADAARDIMRRLVPEAIAATAHARNLVQREQARDDEIQSLSARLLAEFPDLQGHTSPAGDRSQLYWSPKDNGYGEVTISYGANSGEVHLRSLSVEQMVLILQALKTTPKEGS